MMSQWDSQLNTGLGTILASGERLGLFGVFDGGGVRERGLVQMQRRSIDRTTLRLSQMGKVGDDPGSF